MGNQHPQVVKHAISQQEFILYDLEDKPVVAPAPEMGIHAVRAIRSEILFISDNDYNRYMQSCNVDIPLWKVIFTFVL